MPTAELRRTPLYDAHRAAGGRLVGFAGWEMPVQYEGIRSEHLAVRRAAGMFDVSHMGQVETCGPQALEFLQHVLSPDVRRIPVAGAQYGVMCRPDGGILDDLITYRLAEGRYLTVTNASNHASDLAWLREQAAAFGVEVRDCQERFAMLAIQGPRAREILTRRSDAGLPPRMHCGQRVIAGAAALVCGTGYTGEDGVELLLDPGDAPAVWDALLGDGVVACGLGARDTLRLEACFPLYGNDLSTARGPIEAGLGWCCAEATGFIGAEAVAAARRGGPAERLVAFVIDGEGIPRQGNPVLGGGEVTSGSFSPCLERGVGLAYVPAPRAEAGTRIEIDVRGRTRSATIAPKPLYRKG